MTIKEIRERTGLSQAEFAKLYNIPKRSIENWEQGQRTAPPYVVELLDRVVTYDSILMDRFKETQAYKTIEVELSPKFDGILSDAALSKVLSLALVNELDGLKNNQDEDVC